MKHSEKYDNSGRENFIWHLSDSGHIRLLIFIATVGRSFTIFEFLKDDS